MLDEELPVACADTRVSTRIHARWRRSPAAVKKLVVTEKDIVSIVIDPLQETADVDTENNYYPRRIIPSRIESFKRQGSGSLVGRDIMQDSKTELSSEEGDENGGDEGTEQ